MLTGVVTTFSCGLLEAKFMRFFCIHSLHASAKSPERYLIAALLPPFLQ